MVMARRRLQSSSTIIAVKTQCRKAAEKTSGAGITVQRRTLPRVKRCYPVLRRIFLRTTPGINNWDVSFIKRTNITEGVSVQFRAEFFNLFNHTQFAGVNTSFGAAAFGQITSARDPRISQLALRFLF